MLAAAAIVLSPGDGPAIGTPAPRVFEPARMRAVVVEVGENDLPTLQALRSLGADTLITHSNPDPGTAEVARQAGLFYIARMSTQDAARALGDRDYAARLQEVEGLAGLYYEDDQATEGYASPASQEATYAFLKVLFPGVVILFPTRLTAAGDDPAFLDDIFRPQFTDLVTPYFYPVGTTVLGTYGEQDDWPTRLEALLRSLAGRMPPGKGVLPVLQGFEQPGYPVEAGFLIRQMQVYRRVWPETQAAAVFAWRSAETDVLVKLADLPVLQSGVCILFSELSGLPFRCRRTTALSRSAGR